MCIYVYIYIQYIYIYIFAFNWNCTLSDASLHMGISWGSWDIQWDIYRDMGSRSPTLYDNGAGLKRFGEKKNLGVSEKAGFIPWHGNLGCKIMLNKETT